MDIQYIEEFIKDTYKHIRNNDYCKRLEADFFMDSWKRCQSELSLILFKRWYAIEDIGIERDEICALIIEP